MRIGIAAALLVGSVASADAATVQNVQGTILANAGGGFQRTASGLPVPQGTLVMARQNSSASIVYGNGCVEKVEPGKVVTVKTDEACAAAAIAPYAIGAAVVGAGVGLAVGLKGSGPASP